MTVRQLAEKLMELPPDLPVYCEGRDYEPEEYEGLSLVEATAYHPTWHRELPRRVFFHYGTVGGNSDYNDWNKF